MTLDEIKVKTILKGMTMTELAKKININRRTLYIHIKKQNKNTLKKIEIFFEK